MGREYVSTSNIIQTKGVQVAQSPVSGSYVDSAQLLLNQIKIWNLSINNGSTKALKYNG